MADSGKSKKHGRNAAWCKAYKASGTREKNKARKLLRHIKRCGARDHMAVHYFNNMPQRVLLGLPTITPVKSAAKRIPPRVPMPKDQPTPKFARAAQ